MHAAAEVDVFLQSLVDARVVFLRLAEAPRLSYDLLHIGDVSSKLFGGVNDFLVGRFVVDDHVHVLVAHEGGLHRLFQNASLALVVLHCHPLSCRSHLVLFLWHFKIINIQL